MKKSMKAALLSGLVFPGLGHIYLKKYLPGLGLVAASMSALYYLSSVAAEHALRIAEELESGGTIPDIDSISAMLSQASTGTDGNLVNIATVALVICWVVGIIDSYRLGAAAEKQNP